MLKVQLMLSDDNNQTLQYYNLPSNTSPEIIDPNSNLRLDQQAQLFKIFTGINLHYLLRDLECIQIEQMDYQESDIYKIRPDTTFLWNLVEININDVVDYARFCVEKARFFPPFSRQRFTDEQ